MRQYFAAKEQYPDCLMFCRIGDFYELFYEDAILVARELQLTLTARDREKKQPMCGVPYHAAEIYIQRLLKKGYRVALCEQMEDPKTVKGIVKREVTRVVTPGTAMDPALGAEQSNYLASVFVRGAGKDSVCGMALLDLSTGEFRATEFLGVGAWASILDELGRARPVELLYSSGGLWGGPAASGRLGLGEENKQRQKRNTGVLRSAQDDESLGVDEVSKGEEVGGALDGVRTKTAVDEWVFTAEYAVPLLRNHFKVHSLDGMGLAGHEAAAVAAWGVAALHPEDEAGRGGACWMGFGTTSARTAWSWMR